MNIWHPFTQEKTAPRPLKIIRGEKEYLYGENGKRYVDMISSWWVNILGHSQPEIADTIARQAHTLEHVIFAGYTHEPAENLINILLGHLPKSLTKFFFSDNGSTAVEVALKMAYQYFANQGIGDRDIFINLEGAYHGDTIGAMSAAGASSEYHSKFKKFFFETFSIKFPQNAEDEDLSVCELERFLEQNHRKVCALIIEPLVQGAAGMKMHSPQFLDKIVETVRKYGILVIFDEVMTGFYRTGTMFATNQIKNTPDIICLSKALTGGFMPMSLTVTTEKVYDAFWSDDWHKAFIHGHSYTANPLACSAACATQKILQTEEIQRNIRMISETHTARLGELPSKNIIAKRSCGTISAIDLNSSELAKNVSKLMFENGIIIRPLNNTVYFIPPYCISAENLGRAYDILANFLK
ncbi:MAG: adenosylmethionine--8-amino-7-oxononanoate transaminase [Alphaproteobacteria bacterium]|nr:adenosylmethionine--8-amino-7-oxononanoate transaminase [Alphaproteobacteria bacterium]